MFYDIQLNQTFTGFTKEANAGELGYCFVMRTTNNYMGDRKCGGPLRGLCQWDCGNPNIGWYLI